MEYRHCTGRKSREEAKTNGAGEFFRRPPPIFNLSRYRTSLGSLSLVSATAAEPGPDQPTHTHQTGSHERQTASLGNRAAGGTGASFRARVSAGAVAYPCAAVGWDSLDVNSRVVSSITAAWRAQIVEA